VNQEEAIISQVMLAADGLNQNLVRPFGQWLPKVTPSYTWDWPHLVSVREYLDQVTRGEIRKIMFFMPPRHGKTEHVTVRYAAWRLERDPSMPIILGAYNQDLANTFSRKIRRIVKSRVALNPESKAVHDWETYAGGGLRAVGVGAGITGRGGKLILIDDPVKNREEAESETVRESIWNWYKDDLYTRREPGCAIVVQLTRWHEDDLAGRILNSEDGHNWIVIRYPALAEENDPLGRKPGEALCPARYDQEELESIRVVQGRRSFEALYQQNPVPPEGNKFKRAWFEIVPAAPVEADRVRFWDKAASEDEGDFSAGVLIARIRQGIFYIEDCVSGQWSDLERDKVIKQTAQLDAQKYGNIVQVWGEQEPGSSGIDSARAFIRNLAGFPVYAETSSGSKEVRAQGMAAQAEAGNVKLVYGDWNERFLKIACAFPNGTTDDEIDAACLAFNKLVEMSNKPIGNAFDPGIHVIGWREFVRVVGREAVVVIDGKQYPCIPERWGKARAQFWNMIQNYPPVTLYVAVPDERWAFKDCVFVYREHEAQAGAGYDEIAEEIYRAERLRGEEIKLSLINPEAVSQIEGYFKLKDRMKFLPWDMTGRRLTVGVAQLQAYMRIDKERPHPFRPGRMGRSRVYLVVDDREIDKPVSSNGLMLLRQDIS